MDWTFAPAQLAFREEVKQFIKKELPELIAKGEDAYSDANFDSAMEFRRKLGKRKWIGIGWAPEYGGLGYGPIMQMLFHEQMVYHYAPLDGQAYQVGPAIIAHGSEYLKKTFIKATADQTIVWCQGFSEPDAGSDLAGLQTRAEQDGDDYVITGGKIWTTTAHRADYIHILTRTDPNAPKHKGISYFVLDMHSPGITIQPLIDMTGDHHFNQTFFDHVRVPARNMIGEKNQGWYVAMTTLENERSGISDVAGAARALDNVFNSFKEVKGIPGIRKDLVIKHKLGEIGVEVAVARNLAYRVAYMHEKKMPFGREPSMSKLFASETRQRATRAGMEMLGLYGQATRFGKYAVLHGVVPYDYLRNIPNTIAAGTSEVNRNIIAQRGLGLPRGA